MAFSNIPIYDILLMLVFDINTGLNHKTMDFVDSNFFLRSCKPNSHTVYCTLLSYSLDYALYGLLLVNFELKGKKFKSERTAAKQLLFE